jgi:hypothetical protein
MCWRARARWDSGLSLKRSYVNFGAGGRSRSRLIRRCDFHHDSRVRRLPVRVTFGGRPPNPDFVVRLSEIISQRQL